jgi:hypothetical protein
LIYSRFLDILQSQSVEGIELKMPKSGGLLEGEQEDLTSGDKVKFGSLQGILGLEDISKTGN